MIYLDNAGTTRPFDEVRALTDEINDRFYYNPSALFANALTVKNIIEAARETIAFKLGAEPKGVYFTSCATEANNWVFAKAVKNKRGNVVISAGEHASVYESALRLKNQGIDVRIAGLTADGRVDLEDLRAKIDADTALVSVIHCSNETGVVNDLAAISGIIKSQSRAFFHSDGVQAFCKERIVPAAVGVDLYTMSAHKIHGPKGCGALYVNPAVKISPFIVGGGQESGARSGTENVAGIAGFARAAELYGEKYDEKKMAACGEILLRELREFEFNGLGARHSGMTYSFTAEGVRAETVLHMLSDEGIMIGLGSACSSHQSGNRILAAMGKNKKQIEGSFRISFGLYNEPEEVLTAAERIKTCVEKLKKLNCGR